MSQRREHGASPLKRRRAQVESIAVIAKIFGGDFRIILEVYLKGDLSGDKCPLDGLAVTTHQWKREAIRQRSQKTRSLVGDEPVHDDESHRDQPKVRYVVPYLNGEITSSISTSLCKRLSKCRDVSKPPTPSPLRFSKCGGCGRRLEGCPFETSRRRGGPQEESPLGLPKSVSNTSSQGIADRALQRESHIRLKGRYYACDLGVCKEKNL